MIYQHNGLRRFRRINYTLVREASQAVLAVWLLTFPLLPNTIWADLSPVGRLQLYLIASPKPFYIIGLFSASMLVMFAYWKAQWIKKDKPILFFLILIYLGLFMVTALGWEQDTRATSNCVVVLLDFTIGLLAIRVCGSVRHAIQVLCILATMQAVYTLYYRHSGMNDLISGTVPRAGGTFGHPNGVYTTMVLCLPLTVACAFDARRPLQMGLWALSASMMFAALVVTWYRGGILGAALGLTWLGYRLLGRRVSALLIALPLLMAMYIVSMHRVEGSINRASSGRSVGSRYILWRQGLIVFRDHWLTGVGVGALEIPVASRNVGSPSEPTHEIETEPKNVLLFWLDEMGFAGGCLFLLFFIAIVQAVRSGFGSPLTLGVSAAWLSIIISGLSDTPFGSGARPVGNALIGSLLGITLLMPPYSGLPHKQSVSTENA